MNAKLVADLEKMKKDEWDACNASYNSLIQELRDNGFDSEANILSENIPDECTHLHRVEYVLGVVKGEYNIP